MRHPVVLDRVVKYYEEGPTRRSVLNQASAEIFPGSFVVIKGRSGCGKTTLLNLIAGLDLPNSGDIHLGGKIINEMDERSRTLYRRRHCGFVFQFFNLIPTLNIRENLSISLDLNRFTNEAKQNRIKELLEFVGLEDRAESFPDQLSGGEQQRCAICRALAHNPSLMLADEPTGNLDAKTETVVLDLLESLPRQSANTLLIATHSDLVAERADRVLLIEDGELTER